jgi:amino acid adenylation domain-containing protein
MGMKRRLRATTRTLSVGSRTATEHDLRAFAATRLADFKVPRRVVFVEGMPHGATGKLQCLGLAEQLGLTRADAPAPEGTPVVTAPRTPIEHQLAAIWAQVLGITPVGIHDDFFQLGGDSILATQLIARVRDTMHQELSFLVLSETPTIAGIAREIETSGPTIQTQHVVSIPPVTRAGASPLSFAQQRLWFLDQLQPGSPAYNVHTALALSGRLDVTALERSLNEIVRRHEALRTTFTVVDGQPLQVIAPRLTVSVPLLDLQALPLGEHQVQVNQLAVEEAYGSFDLGQGPLFRTKLLRLAQEEHVLLLTQHHIISDGWSLGRFARELSILYEAFAAGTPSPLRELPIQYADFAVWQRQWLQGEILNAHLASWKARLDGVPHALNLPSDYPRPSVQSFKGAQQTLVLSPLLSEALTAISRRCGVTVFMTLLAAFQLLLQRWAGQDDIVIGCPIAGRIRPEIEELIGFFVNTLALRTDLSGNPSFRELLSRVRTVALEAYAHQDLPFEKLVEALHLERDMGRNPLFDVMLNFANRPWGTFALKGLTVQALELDEPISRFPMTLYANLQDDGLRLRPVYQRALYSPESMACVLPQLRHLLAQIVEAPERPIASYSLVTPESHSLLPDPRVALEEPPQALVTNMFLAWAQWTPAQPAVSQGGQTWTYGELAERAEILARALCAAGVRRGDVVAVSGQQGFGIVVSLLGVFLSGGVLLSIDLRLPSQRKQLMLHEAAAKYVIWVGAQAAGEAWLTGSSAHHILEVDASRGQLVRTAEDLSLAEVKLPELSPEDAAYIFFTSGTTGVPKAILGCHKGLSHFLSWQRETFAIGPQDRQSQLISLSFDAVLRDIFLPLMSGATLCLPEGLDHLEPGALLSWLDQERISILHTVPSLAEFWLCNVPAQVSLRTMRWVFFTGEPLTDALVRRWRAVFPDAAAIINLYGPTETTMVKCFFPIPAEVTPGIQPIGRPLPQTQALVLEGNGRLCGIGELGEIVLRTPFRTLGYLNAPEEMREQFRPNPFRNDARDLLYYTGDRGRYRPDGTLAILGRPDGTLAILGRLDDQLKIRGVRVEPHEVAAQLARHPDVQACFVTGQHTDAGQPSLVAYVVSPEPPRVTASQLRSYLGKQLPAAMLPASFVFLDHLPRLPNGKVDRRRLPAPDRVRPTIEGTCVPPRNSVEQVLAGIWAEILQLDRVGVHDNFFELGGHSLLATRVIARLRHTFQVDLPLRLLFEHPSIEALAVTIEETLMEEIEQLAEDAR